jgi:aspartyl aminopeptidase
MSHRAKVPAGLALIGLTLGALPARAAPPCESKECPSSWVQFDAGQRERIFALAEDYKSFMNVARTAQTTVREAERRARAAGFKPWKAGERLPRGSRWYVNNRDAALALFVVGKRPLLEGSRIAAAHIDSPHLQIKGRPLYESEGFALLQTNFHGGILNFQWANTALALVGRIGRKNGTFVDLSVGLAPQDPVFMIAGLSPHVDKDLRERKYRDALEAEELDPLVGSMPLSATEGVKAQVTKYLRDTYGVGLDDFVSADLSLVPAASPRDVGFDRAMMTMYGQDDRLGGYAALRSLLEGKAPEYTAVVFLANNEEVGNVNTTGASSDFLTDLLGEMLYAQVGDSLREPMAKRALRASSALSIDVNDGVNPTWPSAWEGGNAPRVGHGVNIKIYGQGNNAPPEYAAWIRKVLDDAGVQWQTATYKVGKAGGGTLGGELSRRNIDVIDVGVPVMSIHHTYDLSSKVDLWWLVRGVEAFFGAAGPRE